MPVEGTEGGVQQHSNGHGEHDHGGSREALGLFPEQKNTIIIFDVECEMLSQTWRMPPPAFEIRIRYQQLKLLVYLEHFYSLTFKVTN